MRLMFLIIVIAAASNFGFTKDADPFKFKKTNIVLSEKTLLVELAETPEQHQRGLMFRTELKLGTGMLFVFNNEEERAFWMKNTFIPLSIGYFDKNKKLVKIVDMEPAKSEAQVELPSYKSVLPAQFALEVPMGWFKTNNIKEGTKFKFK